MPPAVRSAQAFDVQTDNGAAIRRGLDAALSSEDSSRFPRIEGLSRRRGDILGTVHVSKEHGDATERLACKFRFLVGRRLLYMAGRKDARDLALDEFEKIEELGGMVSTHSLGNEYITRGILDRLREQHGGNFIRKMSMEFGVAGIDYHNSTPLYKLDYQLVQDSCASTHVSFDEFVGNARRVKVRFGIVQLLSYIVRTGRDKPASLNVSPDSSMSLYMDLEAEAWYDILDYLLQEGRRA